MTPRPEDEAQPDTPRAPDDDESPITSRRGGGPDDELDAATPPDGIGMGMDAPTEPAIVAAAAVSIDLETTINLTGDALDIPLRDDMQPELVLDPEEAGAGDISREHLKGLLEALVFASDKPIRAADLARSASAPLREVRLLLAILKTDYDARGVQLDEVAGGWIFRTNAAYAPFVRDLTKQKPVKLTRAQIETLAILAYRQPITRPEIDEIRGVDSGPVLKLLLERDLVKILGKKDEPGRPLLYGTTGHFLEFFGLKSLKELPTLREFTELNEDSRRVVERELGDVLDAVVPADDGAAPGSIEESPATHRVDPDARDLHASIPPDAPPDISDQPLAGGPRAGKVLAEERGAEEPADEEPLADEPLASAPSDEGPRGAAPDAEHALDAEHAPDESHDDDDEQITELHDEPLGAMAAAADALHDDSLHTPTYDNESPADARDEAHHDALADSAIEPSEEAPVTRIEPIPHPISEPPATATWDRGDRHEHEAAPHDRDADESS